ncbi:hypothetical protein KI688_010166 [Linnemannia hyalina]|uniref:ARM repeat-containing protein n=1 Tax=Linnemannia hyalina TaxID=64524 RepID=A0A9P7XZX2_9FUNG|nr:hypothetical protein KI688_010166 [Linnemannia hyalina]
MASNLGADRLIYFTAGVSLVFMMYSVVRHATALFDSEPQESRNILGMVEDKISIDALAKLARSDSIVLQGSSVRILLSRAMHDANLRYILDTVAESDLEEERWKGVTTLQLLTRSESNRTTLVESGALEVLVGVLKDPTNREKSHRYAAVSICELISGSDTRRRQVVQYGILEPLTRFLVKVEPANELQYWSLMVVHQLTACEGLHAELIRFGLVRTLAEMSRLSFGNANMPKICLQSLVRLIVIMDDDDDVRWYLTELLDFDIVPLIATYIRSAAFQLQALNVGIGLRLPKCLASKDDEVKYWALSVAHEFIQHPQWRHQFIESRAFAQVINIGLLIMSRKPLKTATEILPAKEYIIDILVTMWGSGKTTVSFMY